MSKKARDPADGAGSLEGSIEASPKGAGSQRGSDSLAIGLFWGALVIAGLGLGALAVIGVIAIARWSTPSPRPAAATSPAASPRPAAAGSPAASPLYVSFDQLRPGNCLVGSELGLGGSRPWPAVITVVPCGQQHAAEVFFTGNVWPQSRAFPGNNTVANQGWTRCLRAFRAYDRIPYRHSSFTIDYAVPNNTSWSSGDRSVMCVAYEPGLRVRYSIKRSRR